MLANGVPTGQPARPRCARAWGRVLVQPPELVLLGHQERVNCVYLAPDNTTVLSAADDGYLCVWNLPPVPSGGFNPPTKPPSPSLADGNPTLPCCTSALSPRYAVFIGSKVGWGVVRVCGLVFTVSAFTHHRLHSGASFACSIVALG